MTRARVIQAPWLHSEDVCCSCCEAMFPLPWLTLLLVHHSYFMRGFVYNFRYFLISCIYFN